MSYSDLLKDPRWQKKRLYIMERDSFCCVDCGDDKTTLHVHHKTYIKGRLPWDYEDDNFETLCESCHANRHKPEPEQGKPLPYVVEKRPSVSARENLLRIREKYKDGFPPIPVPPRTLSGTELTESIMAKYVKK